MIDIETSFGFFTCDTKEIPQWDKDLIKGLDEWLSKDRYIQ